MIVQEPPSTRVEYRPTKCRFTCNAPLAVQRFTLRPQNGGRRCILCLPQVCHVWAATVVDDGPWFQNRMVTLH